MDKITYQIYEEVPGVDPAEQFYVTNTLADGVGDRRIEQYKSFATVEAAREYFHGFGIPDEQIAVVPFVP